MQVVFPDIEAAYYEHSEVQSIMLYVLRHYHFLADVDAGFRRTLRSLAFMPRSDMLTTIDRFYDPDHELLQKLFLFEENFPAGEYSDPSIVAVLREVGLIYLVVSWRRGQWGNCLRYPKFLSENFGPKMLNLRLKTSILENLAKWKSEHTVSPLLEICNCLLEFYLVGIIAPLNLRG